METPDITKVIIYHHEFTTRGSTMVRFLKNKKVLTIFYIVILTGAMFGPILSRLEIDGLIGDEVWYTSASRNLLHKIGIDVHYTGDYNGVKVGGVTVVYLNGKNDEDKNYVQQLADKYKVVQVVVFTREPNMEYYLVPKQYEKQFIAELRKNKNLDVIPGYMYPDEPQIYNYYNLEHPALAKVFIMLSMVLFGDNPWAWRVPSVIMLIITLVFMSLAVYRITNSYLAAAIAYTLGAIDPALKVMGSVGMLDIYPAAFGAIMLYTWVLAHQNRENKDLYAVYLILAGLFLGLATSTKLTGAFAVFGLIFYIAYYSEKFTTFIKDGLLAGLGAAAGFVLGNLPVAILVTPQMWLNGFLSSFSWHLSYKGTHPFDSPFWQWFYNANPFTIYMEPRIEVQSNWFLLSLTVLLLIPAVYYFRKYSEVIIPASSFVSIILSFAIMYFLGGKSNYSFYVTVFMPPAIILDAVLLKEMVNWEAFTEGFRAIKESFTHKEQEPTGEQQEPEETPEN